MPRPKCLVCRHPQAQGINLALLRGGSVRNVAKGDAILIAFDSSAKRVSADSLETMAASEARGSLSAALVAAHRAMIAVTAGRERTELILVSPAVREEVDSATSPLLALWQGQVRYVRVAVADPPMTPSVLVRAIGDDPIAAVLSRGPHPLARVPAESREPSHGIRIVRTSPTSGDSLWARDSGGVLVIWPVDASGLTRRPTLDTQNAIAAGSNVVVASFARTHQPRPGRVLVRWNDGEAAATERPLGNGCIREVAIPVDPVGDVALRESFRGVVGALTEPCGGARDFVSALGSRLSALGQGPKTDSRERVSVPFAGDDNRLPLLLAAIALAVLISEQFLLARVRTTA